GAASTGGAGHAWHDQAWRDPWVFRAEQDGRFHALVTARVPTGPAFERGVVGHAVSDDLVRWEGLPPVTRPLGVGQLEVPQAVRIGQRWYLLFASDVDTQGERWRAVGPGTGTYYLVGDSPTGPFELVGDGALAADQVGSTYAGRVHEGPGGDPVF